VSGERSPEGANVTRVGFALITAAMRGHVPAIHVLGFTKKDAMAGTSSAMTRCHCASPLLVMVVPWMQRSMSEQQQFEMFDNQPAHQTACESRAFKAH
jgi:hypothetical protein